MTCQHCGARLSRYAEPGTTMCAPCFKTHGTHVDYIDTIAWRTKEAPTVCQRGHDLGVHATNGTCEQCRRDRNREYARARRRATA